MVKSWFISIALLCAAQAEAFEKMADRYWVTLGNPHASTQVVEYYSFSCPYCLALFKKEFRELKAKHLDTGTIHIVFHPIPMDLLTVCAMDCLVNLNETERRTFLQVMLETIEEGDQDIAITLMKRAMELLGHPLPRLEERDYLQETQAFQDAFQFLKQSHKVDALPTVEINGVVYPNDIPSIEFLEGFLKREKSNV